MVTQDRLWSSLGRMADARARAHVEALLVESGVEIGGDEPWDPIVKNPRVFSRLVREGTLGLGESYVDGDWDCEALDELASRVTSIDLDRHVGPAWREIAGSVIARIVDRQAIAAAASNASKHYDLGDDLYAAMLGPTMVYSCGYWRAARTLDDAQRAKLELACAKLELGRDHTLLDAGCGWGELARHAAARHGAKVLGITVSRNQAEHARARCAGLPVEIHCEDWRAVRGRFDRIVSIGMFEHVGPRNYRRFFARMQHLLAPDGLLVLQTIGKLRESAALDGWLDRYIFPGAVLPTAAQIAAGTNGLFVIEDWQNLGTHYDRTLMAWHDNFERAWPQLKIYGDRFRRMWRYYLLTCAGTFRARRNQLWQIVLSPEGRRNGYERPLL